MSKKECHIIQVNLFRGITVHTPVYMTETIQEPVYGVNMQ